MRDGADLRGQVVIVTGANQGGIGYETGVALAHMGAHVVCAGRSNDRGLKAVKGIKEYLRESKSKLGGDASFSKLDLASLSSIRQFVAEFEKSFGELHILINNAGVHNVMDYVETIDGIESHWGINHVGPFELTRLLLPIMRRTKAKGEYKSKRVVMVTSYGHTFIPDSEYFDVKMMPFNETTYPSIYQPFKRMFYPYAVSKLANILMAKELATREQEITAYSVHPGVISTNIGAQRPGATIWDSIAHHASTIGTKLFWGSIPYKKSLSQGAATTVKCAVWPKWQRDSGKFYSDLQNGDHISTKRAKNATLARELWLHTENLLSTLT